MFNNLTLVQRGANYYIDSREVTELIGKRHDNLIRDIDGYIRTLEKSNALKNEGVRFFVKSSYSDVKGEMRPCYLLSKMGCEMVANKLTGEKGVLFTAAYVFKFNVMETHWRAEWEKSQKLMPTLADCNDTAKIVVEQLKRTGASTYRILDFLEELYQPLGVEVTQPGEYANIPQTYTALQIARICGVYSLYGNPHAQAISCLLNEYIGVNDKHKIVVSDDCLSGVTGGYRYDEYALGKAREWLGILGYPGRIYGAYRTYHVIYRSSEVAA